MNEMQKQFSPEASRETADPYADWTESQRMTEYADTGDPQYLTPELAKKMQVTPDAMREVVGATPQDISDAEEWHAVSEAAVDGEIDSLLKQYGADRESLESKGIHEQFRSLLNVASIRVSDTRFDEGFDNETIREEAMQRMFDIVLDNQESMYRLFEVLQLDSPKGLRDIGVVDQLIHYLKSAYERGSQHARASLYELLDIAERTLEMEFHPQANYLGAERLSQLLRSESGKEQVKSDVDMYVPFEITEGVYAVFSSDSDRVFVADDEMSKDIKSIVRTGWTKEYMGEEGHNLPSYKYEYIPEDLMYSIDGVIDAGTPLDEMALEIGITDPDIVTDYITTLRSSSREIIETKFGFRLTNLTIKEQLYFLSYLKDTTVEQAETMQRFTSLYGVDGMRTFLSLERGDETLGDHIVAFGQHDEVAGTVFTYYGELLNSAERAEVLVKEVSDCEGEACTELANQVRENILNRAQKDLEKAVRSHDPSEVAAQIENYVAAAKEYVALLQEVGVGKIESVSPESLTEEERARMQDLLRTNYNKAYPEPENEDFKTAVAGSLEKSFSNPDTSFRVLRDNGKIVSYNRFDTIRDFTGKEVSYFGSFNADPAYSGVGGVMLEETIKDQLETGRPMMAHCDPTQVITRKYIEDGFVATGFYELAGKLSFEIWRSKDSSAQLESKGRPVDELLESVGESGAMIVREQSESESYPELQNGMSLTRYFTHDGKTYLVFETLPDTLKREFTPPQEEQKKAA